MRNVWKGLIVGGLTGVVAGKILDSLAGASKKASALGDQVLEHAPDAGHLVQSVADKAGEWLHDADVPEQVRSVAHRLKDSDARARVVEAGHGVASAAPGSGRGEVKLTNPRT
jgi:hypothetical protein